MKKAIEDITKIHRITEKCTMKTIIVKEQLRKNNNFSSHDNDTYNTLHCSFRQKGYI